MQLGENVKQLLHSLKYACLYCLLSVTAGVLPNSMLKTVESIVFLIFTIGVTCLLTLFPKTLGFSYRHIERIVF